MKFRKKKKRKKKKPDIIKLKQQPSFSPMTLKHEFTQHPAFRENQSDFIPLQNRCSSVRHIRGTWPQWYPLTRAPLHNISNKLHHQLPPSTVKSSPIMTGAILYRRLAFIAIVNGPAGMRLAVVHSERCTEINKRRIGFFSSVLCLKAIPAWLRLTPGPRLAKGEAKALQGKMLPHFCCLTSISDARELAASPTAGLGEQG